jgi:hypothetical protein
MMCVCDSDTAAVAFSIERAGWKWRKEQQSGGSWFVLVVLVIEIERRVVVPTKPPTPIRRKKHSRDPHQRQRKKRQFGFWLVPPFLVVVHVCEKSIPSFRFTNAESEHFVPTRTTMHTKVVDA